MKATQSQLSFAVGSHVALEFGGHDVIGRVIEDFGPIGVRGRHILKVEAYLPLDEMMILEIPAEEVTEAKCQGHENGFRHLDPNIAVLDAYDLGIKLMDSPAPPPPGSPSEPRLYVFVSVRGSESGRDVGSIHYARSRTYLLGGFPSSEADRRRLTAAVLDRLERDVERLVAGDLHSSEEEPIFLQAS